MEERDVTQKNGRIVEELEQFIVTNSNDLPLTGFKMILQVQGEQKNGLIPYVILQMIEYRKPAMQLYEKRLQKGCRSDACYSQ